MRFIILVRPSSMMKTLLAMLRPFMSTKAHQKIKTVRIPDQLNLCHQKLACPGGGFWRTIRL